MVMKVPARRIGVTRNCQSNSEVVERPLLSGFKANGFRRGPLGGNRRSSRDKQRSRGAGLTGQRSPGDVVPTPLRNDILDRSIIAAASTSVQGTTSTSPWP